jgi:hypothetical protein
VARAVAHASWTAQSVLNKDRSLAILTDSLINYAYVYFCIVACMSACLFFLICYYPSSYMLLPLFLYVITPRQFLEATQNSVRKVVPVMKVGPNLQ